MENQLEKRYGLITAICVVVGIVVGSGVFFKAEKILVCTDGRTTLGILAWLIGGIIMVSCAYVFGVLASHHEKCNGIVDYAEEMCGEKYGYIVGWFMATIYYPTLTSVLAWVTARYFSVLVGWDIVGPQCMAMAGFLLILAYVSNSLSPIIAGKVQVATTVIKFIPLLLMAIVGTIFGLHSGMTFENFRIVKDIRNSINREVNCETANISKIAGASVKQIEDIEFIDKLKGRDFLPDSLREVADIRVENPLLSLKELGEMMNPPIGKSGVNHRLRRISILADKLREEL